MPFRESTSIDTPFAENPSDVYPNHPLTGYVADEKGEPILPEGMRKLLESDLNRTFEF